MKRKLKPIERPDFLKTRHLGILRLPARRRAEILCLIRESRAFLKTDEYDEKYLRSGVRCRRVEEEEEEEDEEEEEEEENEESSDDDGDDDGEVYHHGNDDDDDDDVAAAVTVAVAIACP